MITANSQVDRIKQKCANAQIKEALAVSLKYLVDSKRKHYSLYTIDDRAKIGKYASYVNDTSAALKCFRVDFLDLGESTMRSYKMKYITALE